MSTPRRDDRRGVLVSGTQFSTAGVQLQSQFHAALANQKTLGGEFAINPVPEPSSLALGAIGGVVALGISRRRKAARA